MKSCGVAPQSEGCERYDLTPQDPARPGVGELALLPGDGAVHHRVLDALRRHDDALGAARQVEATLAVVARADAAGIEDRHVAGRALGEAAAVAEAEEIGRVGGELAHAFLER